MNKEVKEQLSAERRQEIKSDADLMKVLLNSPAFKRFEELIKERIKEINEKAKMSFDRYKQNKSILHVQNSEGQPLTTFIGLNITLEEFDRFRDACIVESKALECVLSLPKKKINHYKTIVSAENAKKQALKKAQKRKDMLNGKKEI
ncbi:MAG: hypothetical protein ACFFG0_03480 [Candidatus Thorarchaeota archaeon]